MVDKIFRYYRQPIGDAYKAYINDYLGKIGGRTKGLCDLYENYAVLDSNFPRPILTFLGINANANELKDISTFRDIQLLFIPQLVRDFLAIHDDIIDEDLIKFNCDSLPYSFSKVHKKDTLRMNKWGKDVALLFADMQLSAPLNIISSLYVDHVTRMKLLNIVSQIFLTTNKGQIDELLLNDIPLGDISPNEIADIYQNKAADYCYAFPLTLGLVYSEANSQIIEEMRMIMLKLGFFSQIINDIEGVFFEHFDNERDTLSDLMFMRRTYLLVKFYHSTNDDNKKILNLPNLSKEQANFIKNEIINSRVILELKNEIEMGCVQLKEDITSLQIGMVLKEYLLGLVNSRILANISKV